MKSILNLRDIVNQIFISLVCLYNLSAQQVILNPAKDSYVQDGTNANTNYGASTDLVVKSGSLNFTRESFLNFNISNIPERANIFSSKLRLKINLRESGELTHELKQVDDDSWSETGITWNNKPTTQALLDSNSAIGSVGTWVEFDITSYIKDKLLNNENSVSMSINAVANPSLGYSKKVDYFSSESSLANRPELVIDYSSTYYVDKITGSDANDGRSELTAWETLDKIESTSLQPGDSVLLRSGSVWSDELTLSQSGTEDNPIVIDYYLRSGDNPDIKPVINGPGDENINEGATVLIHNADYVEINNLEVTNVKFDPNDSERRKLWGILGLKDDGGEARHLYIRNCYVHDVNRGERGTSTGGIYVLADGPLHVQSWYNGLLIENNFVEYVGGMGITWQTEYGKLGYPDKSGGKERKVFLNVSVKSNIVKDTGKNNMIIRASENAVAEHNTLINSSRSQQGHSIFCFNTINVKIQYNEAYGNTGTGFSTNETRYKDRGGFDADWNCVNTIIQYNYSHDNFWAYAIMRKKNDNVIIRYNLSQNDQKAIYYYGFSGVGQSKPEKKSTKMTRATIYNNTHFVESELDEVAIFGSDEFYGSEAYNSDFFNNIFHFESTNQGLSNKYPSDNVNFENNIFYNVPVLGSNVITADPQLIAPGSGGTNIDWSNYPDVLNGYKLLGTSPAIDAGRAVANNGGQDFWGNPLYSGAPDIGAHEFLGNSTTTAVIANHDAHVRDGSGNENQNYGTRDELELKKANVGYNRLSYLKFDISGISGTIIDAYLRLTVKNSGFDIEDTNLELTYGSDDNWSENTITWGNKPTLGVTPIDVRQANDSEILWDLKSLIDNNTIQNGNDEITLGLKSLVDGATLKIDFYSKEGAGTQDGLKPTLILTTTTGNSSRVSLKAKSKKELGEFQNVRLYPNPAKSKVYVQGLDTISNLEIISVYGKVMPLNVQSFYDTNTMSFDISHLPSGLYFLTWYNADGMRQSKTFVIK